MQPPNVVIPNRSEGPASKAGDFALDFAGDFALRLSGCRTLCAFASSKGCGFRLIPALEPIFVGNLNRQTLRKPHLFDQRRTLLKIAISNPLRAHHKISNPRPTHPRRPIRPNRKINILKSFQFRPARQLRHSFVLHRLLPSPPHHKRTSWPRHQIPILP